MTPLLQLVRVCKEFRATTGRAVVRAVDDVSLDVDAGETLGLVGESGCGKTTLARCALRLLEPTSGKVRFDGLDLLRLSAPELRRRRREFQMVFQDSSACLNPYMTVGEILSEPLAAHGIGTAREREARVRSMLGEVSLDEALITRRPAQLSGGEQQRLVIARALALGPRLLVADEPVSSLDASVQAQVLNLLAEVRARFGLTLVLVSHSLPVVRYLSTRVAVMRGGRVVETAPADDFFAAPRHPYSRALLEGIMDREDRGSRDHGGADGE